jgi:hypothetical protein
MTGDDSYHAHCFKCRSCRNRIDELMFAKTSHGIYCMRCHHQRVARSRRHAQKQKEREHSRPTSNTFSSHGPPANEQPGVSRVCCFLNVTLTPPTAYPSLPERACSFLCPRSCPRSGIIFTVHRRDAGATFAASSHVCSTCRKQGHP